MKQTFNLRERNAADDSSAMYSILMLLVFAFSLIVSTGMHAGIREKPAPSKVQTVSDTGSATNPIRLPEVIIKGNA